MGEKPTLCQTPKGSRQREVSSTYCWETKFEVRKSCWAKNLAFTFTSGGWKSCITMKLSTVFVAHTKGVSWPDMDKKCAFALKSIVIHEYYLNFTSFYVYFEVLQWWFQSSPMTTCLVFYPPQGWISFEPQPLSPPYPSPWSKVPLTSKMTPQPKLIVRFCEM